MSSERRYPRRLIEVDLPIKAISAHARREKSIKEGHISTLHIWWARRPLAACRAVILAALWPDPVDPLCPERFRVEAAEAMKEWRDRRGGPLRDWSDPGAVRAALLEFIAEFANWDNSTNTAYLERARRLVQVAHESLTGLHDRPVVADPFAGGGAIPFEALRIGASPFASDLNPLPVLMNKVLLEHLPTYGERLVEQVEHSGARIRRRLQERLDKYYGTKRFESGRTPFAYFWARTIACEGPGCGIRFPLVRSLWLRNKGAGTFALSLNPDMKTNTCVTRVLVNPPAKSVASGTSKQGAAICPACGYTTPVERVRVQLSANRGGTVGSQLLAICEVQSGLVGKQYREPTASDIECYQAGLKAFEATKDQQDEWGRRLPDERLNHLRGFFNVVLYGMSRWGDLVAPRQALLMMELTLLIRNEYQILEQKDRGLAEAVATVLTLAGGKTAQYNSSCCRWKSKGENLVDMFGRQAIPMVWDFAEAYPFGETTGDYGKYVNNACGVLRRALVGTTPGTVVRSSATEHSLSDDFVDAFITDPPYYDAIPYADLSDYFYVWFRRALGAVMPDLFRSPLTPKDDECVVLAHRAAMYRNKDRGFFENMMSKAMADGRRVTKPSGIGVIVFANKSTAGWEAMLLGLIEGGWVITGSWPIDTEMGSRLRARDSAVLSSSVHLVCRPRELPDGRVADNAVGDWRAVLRELPTRIHEWMPRLAREGVVGADAIFACLGPALEIYSRYSRVEKASGERVELRDYLEQVWATVAKEAFSLIFSDGDATDLEPDARLTAIWFWALHVERNGSKGAHALVDPEASVEDEAPDEINEDNRVTPKNARKPRGYTMEFDTARKLAQGLGVHLETMAGQKGILEIKGSLATIRTVSDRSSSLLGAQGSLFDFGSPGAKWRSRTQGTGSEKVKMKAATEREGPLFDVQREPVMPVEQRILPGIFPPDTRTVVERLVDGGRTTLDRLHQAMLLFGRGQTGLIGPMLVATGMASQPAFWKLAQSLSALYPSGTDEKRWVDGVLARKKGLGFG